METKAGMDQGMGKNNTSGIQNLIKPGTKLVKSPTDNLDAYSVYLRGIFYWSKFTPDNIKKAVTLFEEAIGLDPDFAAAYSGLANCYNIYGAFGVMLPRIAYTKARDYAHKALELDDELYDSHLSLALVNILYDWEPEIAWPSIKRAIELNPGASNVHYVHAIFLHSQGRISEAVEKMEDAYRIDPLSMPINKNLAFVYLCSGRYQDAYNQVEKAMEIDPTHTMILEIKGWYYLMKKEIEKAYEVFEHCVSSDPSNLKAFAGMGYAYAVTGRTDDAKRMPGQTEKTSGRKPRRIARSLHDYYLSRTR